MPNNRAAASPKRAPCRFEELMGEQLTEDKRKVQQMRRYRRSGRTSPRGSARKQAVKRRVPRHRARSVSLLQLYPIVRGQKTSKR